MALKGVFYGYNELGYIVEDETFKSGISMVDGIRLLKTKYPTTELFEKKYLVYFDYENCPDWNLRGVLSDNNLLDQRLYDEYARVLTELREAFLRIYNQVEPFTESEVLELNNPTILYHLNRVFNIHK